MYGRAVGCVNFKHLNCRGDKGMTWAGARWCSLEWFSWRVYPVAFLDPPTSSAPSLLYCRIIRWAAFVDTMDPGLVPFLKVTMRGLEGLLPPSSATTTLDKGPIHPEDFPSAYSRGSMRLCRVTLTEQGNGIRRRRFAGIGCSCY